METSDESIELQIAEVLSDIRQKGYSSVQPFIIGRVEERMTTFVHPNYQMKVSREVVKLVNFITATRRTDKKEFNGKRYIKIWKKLATRDQL